MTAPSETPAAASRFRLPRHPVLATAIVVALVVAVALRFVTSSDLWLDEALTVNIARLPLGELREALLRDGAPPLYYVLLHWWMQVFGTGDLAVRSFSGVLGVVMLVLSYQAGHRLAKGDERRRRWGAWATVLVVASSPFAIRYSTESRMYMLTMVIVLAGSLAVGRMVDHGPSAGRVAAVAVTSAALLYTQYWAVFLLAVVGAVFLYRAWRAAGSERRASKGVLLGLVIGGVLFLPWVPTFLSQMAHTGTPWDRPVTPPTAIATGLLDFAGGKTVEGWSAILVLILLGLLALVGRSTGRYTVALDLRTVPGVRWEWIVGAGTLIVGIVASYATGTGFQARYAAVMFPFFALAVAMGLLVLGDERVRIGVLTFLVLVGFVGGARNLRTNRTQASQAVDIIAAESEPGDLVVNCPDQLGPDTERLLSRRTDLRQVVYPTFESPEFVDWVDYEERNAAGDPEAFAGRALEAADGNAIWVIWSPNYRTFEGQCERLLNGISAVRGLSTDRVVADQNIYEFMGLREFPAP
jgi:mannosyltransferase